MSFDLSTEMKSAIETAVGVKLDGKLTIEDAKKVYDFLHAVAKQIRPDIDDDIDEGIDRVEAYAMKRKPLAKSALLALTKAVRGIAGVPDDDDNTVQK